MKVSKMFVVVAMMVASTGLQAHATTSSSSQTPTRVNMDDPEMNGSAKDCPFKTAGQNRTAQDSVVSLNDSASSQDSKVSMRGIAR